MLFNSFQFLWLFPLVFFAYWGGTFWMKGKKALPMFANALLLWVSYGLYVWWNPVAALFLLGVTAVTYLFALWIERKEAYGKKKFLMVSGVLLAFLPLTIFKYYNFLLSALSGALAFIGVQVGMPGMNWIVPLGISFFTFQAVGYLWDVYYQKVKAEHSWWDYMLFVAFFPQIASGPISKYKDLMPQIKAMRQFDSARVLQGGKCFLWGMFLKVVLADRLGLLVDSILPHYENQTGASCALAAVLYSFQIYGDFAGYSLMAVGVGRMLGFELVNNFNRPYFAATVTEFWKRWHISLTKWLTDYVYIPLGGSRCSKSRNYYNIIVTFLVSGIWHGANWTFIVWGLLHGLFQIVEKGLGWQKCGNAHVRPFRVVFTFLLVTVAWVFFRMPTLEDGCGVLLKICTEFGHLSLSSPRSQILLSFSALAVVCVVEASEKHGARFSLLNHKSAVVRWATCLVLVSSILLCGVLDAGSFIYVSF